MKIKRGTDDVQMYQEKNVMCCKNGLSRLEISQKGFRPKLIFDNLTKA